MVTVCAPHTTVNAWFSDVGTGTSKHYSGYGLTSLGVQQNFQVGGNFRETYISSNSSKRILGISEKKAVNSQLFATAPDQTVLLNTATAFLQGLYPPLENVDPLEVLNNGSAYGKPLNGYQYLVLHSEDADAPDVIWLKGDEECPVVTKSAKSFKSSSEFEQMDAATRSFYKSFWDIIDDVYDYSQPSNLSYANAYDIYDLLNVGSIHNHSMAGNISEEDLFQLRTLADSAEFALNYNKTDVTRSIGGQTFAGAVLDQLNQTVTGKGKLKFSLMAGSYDTFLAFFGLTNLTSISTDFYGLPHYASTMSFELFTNEDVDAFPSNTGKLRVRFLFRNGTEDALHAVPLFGRSENSMVWSEFVSSMRDISITGAEQWCNVCQSELLFCAAYNSTSTQSDRKDSGMSNAVAGVIGAAVTLGAVAILAAIAFLVLRRRRAVSKVEQISVTAGEKGSVRSDSESA